MPYSGASDPNLPDNVQKLPDKERGQWVEVFNSSFEKCEGDDCESVAFRNANGVVKVKQIISTYELKGQIPIIRYKVFAFTCPECKKEQKESGKCDVCDVQMERTLVSHTMAQVGSRVKCDHDSCTVRAEHALEVNKVTLTYCTEHIEGAVKVLEKHRLSVSGKKNIGGCEWVEVKEGRFVTIDGRPTFVGGPGQGGGSSGAGGTGIALIETPTDEQFAFLSSQIEQWDNGPRKVYANAALVESQSSSVNLMAVEENGEIKAVVSLTNDSPRTISVLASKEKGYGLPMMQAISQQVVNENSDGLGWISTRDAKPFYLAIGFEPQFGPTGFAFNVNRNDLTAWLSAQKSFGEFSEMEIEGFEPDNGVFVITRNSKIFTHWDTKEHHTTAAIMLKPPADIAEGLALDQLGASQPDDLHVTIAYLGEINNLDKEQVMDKLAAIASKLQPIGARINGVTRFTETHKEDQHAVVLNVDSPEIELLRNVLVEQLELEPGNHGFTPHLTLSFIPSTQDMPDDILLPADGVEFDSMWAFWGDERFKIEFGDSDEDDKAKKPKQPDLDSIAAKIAKEPGKVDADTIKRDLLEPWLMSTMGTPASQQLQKVAARTFGHQEPADLKDLQINWKLLMPMGGIYNLTQKALEKEGHKETDTIPVYRPWIPSTAGGKSFKKDDEVRIKMNPITSWSTSIKEAVVFAEFLGSPGKPAYVLRTFVPIKSVVSTAQTGFGVPGTKEAVLAGGEYESTVMARFG